MARRIGTGIRIEIVRRTEVIRSDAGSRIKLKTQIEGEIGIGTGIATTIGKWTTVAAKGGKVVRVVTTLMAVGINMEIVTMMWNCHESTSVMTVQIIKKMALPHKF